MPTVQPSNPPTLFLYNEVALRMFGGYRTYEELSNWYHAIPSAVAERMRRIMEQYYDFSSTWITRKCDGAILFGGWDWRRSSNQVRAELSHEEFHKYTKWLPFEWWHVHNGGEHTAITGMERVYSSSYSIPEVFFFLCIEVYYKEQGKEFNIGRNLWSPNHITAPYDVFNHVHPLVHGFENNGNYITNDFLAGQGIVSMFDEPVPGERDENDFVRVLEPLQGKNVDNKGRTLLKLLSKLVDKWDELILNEKAYTWGWITQQIKLISLARYKKLVITHPTRILRSQWQLEFNNHVCEMLLRKTGKPWMYLPEDEQFWPRCMLKSYYTQDEDRFGNTTCITTWTKAKNWERLQDTGRIVWADNAKFWVTAHCVYIVKKGTGQVVISTGLPAYITITKGITPTFWKDHATCTECNSLVIKADILPDEDLGYNTCIYCGTGAKENLRPTAATVYGNYHGHRDWRFYYSRTKQDNPKCFCFGMEIEMHNKHENTASGAKDAAWHIYRQQIKINPKWNLAYWERDGSLAEGGLEMVTNPMSLEFHREYWTALLPAIREYCTGWNTEEFNGNDSSKNNYGIHITFSRKYWTDLQLARLIKFIDNTSNKVFIRAIAQRKAIYSGEALAENKRLLKDKVSFKEKGKIGTAQNRYVPVNVKDKLVELRFFRTTLNTQSFLKNIEFVAAFHDWVSSSGYNDKAEAFIDWLCGNKLAHRKYENLIGYLSREKFPCKGGSLANPWRERMEAMKKEQLSLFPLMQPKPPKDEILEKDIELCA